MRPSERILTQRELEVADYLSLGHSYQMIAYDMRISVNTVKAHVQSIYTKVGVGNKTALANWYRDTCHPKR